MRKRVELAPTAATLEQNYPNPFNPATTIGYRLELIERILLAVYDVLGSVTLAIMRQS